MTGVVMLLNPVPQIASSREPVRAISTSDALMLGSSKTVATITPESPSPEYGSSSSNNTPVPSSTHRAAGNFSDSCIDVNGRGKFNRQKPARKHIDPYKKSLQGVSTREPEKRLAVKAIVSIDAPNIGEPY